MVKITDNPYEPGGMSTTRIPSQDMSNMCTLHQFITDCMSKANYKRHCLIMCGHGEGWFIKTEEKTFMGIGEFAYCISKMGIVLDLLIFDACMMSVIEPMHQLSGMAKIIVANQDYAQNNGFIKPLLPVFFNDLSLQTEEIAKLLAIGFFDELDDTDDATDVTIIMMNKLPKLVSFLDDLQLRCPRDDKFCIDSTYWQLQDLYSVVKFSVSHETFEEFRELFNSTVIFYRQSSKKFNPYHHGLFYRKLLSNFL